MTHEQKPESAEFRAREEQPWNGYPDHPEIDGFHWLKQTGCGRLIPFEWVSCDENWLFDDNSDGFPDEVAGMFSYHGPCSPPEVGEAAEQRRKDAEGAEPVGYVLAGLKELFSNPADPLSAAMILASKDAPHIVPLYARPANVAALEARVKKLEGALRNVRAAIEQAGPKVLVCTLWMPGQPETVVDYISAAVREGGKK